MNFGLKPHLFIGLILFLFYHNTAIGVPLGQKRATTKEVDGYVKEAFSITATIEGLPDGIIFYLIKFNETGGADTISKSISKMGHFDFKGKIPLSPELHFVKMDTSVVKLLPGKNSWIRLLLDNSDINIKGEMGSWPKMEITGSIATVEYDSVLSRVTDVINEFNSKIKEVKKDSAKINSYKKDLSQHLIKLLKLYPNYPATPLIVSNLNILSLAMNEDIYNALTPSVKNSFYGKRLYKNIASLKVSRNISLGETIPRFSLSTQKGENIDILVEAAKNKITLLDFWASWCKPCRAEIPNLMKVFNDFHHRGFNIIGISSDEKIKAWENALIEDKTPWLQGIEKDDKVGKEIFRLRSIPAYVLIDSKGRLLAFERGMSSIEAFGPAIRGSELYATIERILNEIEKK